MNPTFLPAAGAKRGALHSRRETPRSTRKILELGFRASGLGFRIYGVGLGFRL